MGHLIADATVDDIFGGLSPEAFYAKHRVMHREAFMTNRRGMKIFTQNWEPVHQKLRGVVLAVHGFTVDSSWALQLTAIGIAKRGFSVHAFDIEGHGRSDGFPAHVPDMNTAADDCIQFSEAVKQQYATIPFFVYAESFGAAIALLVHFRHPTLFEGMILHGAMCGVSDRFAIQSPIVLRFAALLAKFLPTWRLCFTPDNVRVAIKEPWKRKLLNKSPFKKVGSADLATGLETVRVANYILSHVQNVSVPFLAVHGGEDKVCDLGSVRILHEKACSKDKSLKVYAAMWHMFVGESQELTDLVFRDILAWLDERAAERPSKS